MSPSGLKQNVLTDLPRLFITALLALICLPSAFGQTNTGVTTINITDTPKLKGAKRLGLNLGNQDFYDSGQFMRNLAFRNPGFEAETWQTILHCQFVTATSCTDDMLYNYWPANFMAGAQAEFIVGAATGTTAKVKSSTASTIGATGVTVNFDSLSVAPAAGDYVVLRLAVPGNAQGGWWTGSSGGATFTTEYNDLAPNTPGKQALRITQGPSDQASLASYMDSVTGRSFLQLSGGYTLTFRAKGTGGNNQVGISFGRAVTGPPGVTYFTQNVTLSNSWKDYKYKFTAQDTGRVGTLALKFLLQGSSMLIDDVALTADAAPDNPTVYRNEVVSTLKALKPGILRFMDSGTNWGSSFDNLLQPDFARQRAGYSDLNSEADDIPLNLHDYLELCQLIGAEPWFTMPTGMTTQEMSDVMDYFGGSTSTPYGARRAALGQTAAWTTVFPKIHLEFGNEVWNTANPGASMNDPYSYGKRAGVIFTAAKKSASYSAKSFDLVQDGFQANPSWSQQALSTSTNYDTVDAAAYIFSNLNDASSTEAIYGPMLGEPEAFNSTATGIMAQNAQVAAAANPPARLAIYEENMGTIQGTASQDVVNRSIASVGAGIAVAQNMLTLLRDLGVTDQNMFALPGLTAPFTGTGGSNAKTSPIWGVVVDMGGPTNLVRPMYLSEQLANTAILPTLLTATQSGNNPTWNQPYTTNDNFSLANAHYIQSFVFTDGNKLNIILFNLSRTKALPVNFAGLNAPLGAATISTLTAPSIDATNDVQENVTINSATQSLSANSTLSLAPFSMTVISVDAPLVPVFISSVTISCDSSSLSPADTTSCTSNVGGQGKYNTNVAWSVDNGKIDSNGNYTAAASAPASGKAVVTATSLGDSTKKTSFTILIAKESITGVTASCGLTSIGQGQLTSCKATVQGTGSFDPSFTWTSSDGSISSNGAFTAPQTGTSVSVTATSTEDPTKSFKVNLTLFPVLIIGTAHGTATNTTATITWPLNMPAYSGISYGPSQSYGSSTPYAGVPTNSPSFTLTGLSPSTTYFMTVYSFVNNQFVSEFFSIKTSGGSSTVTGVSVACPSVAGLNLGGILPCSATVTGTGGYSSAVNWSVSAGSVTSAGVLTLPLLGTSVTVKATSVQDATKSASITLSLTGQSTITGLSVACASSSVTAGHTIACTAPVTGTGGYSSGVTWSASGGSITAAGVLTAPTTGNSVTVKATSTQDTTKSATAIVSVTPASTITGVTIACATSTLSTGGSTNCAPTVTGTGSFSSAVTWTTTAGTISPAGLLTAPNTGTSLTVTATSTADSTKSGSVTIALTAGLIISNPVTTITSSTVSVGWTLNLPAHSGISYGATASLGGSTSYDSSLDSTPNYTITNLQPSTTYTLVLYSFLNGQTVSKQVVVTTGAAPTITSISATCGTNAIVVKGTLSCSAQVAGTSSFASTVTWSTSAGSITPAGVLTAPATGTSVTVTATSTQDTTKSATAKVSLDPVIVIANAVATTTSTSATVGWTLNVPSHSGISYGPTAALGASTPYDSNLDATPTYTLTGLQPSTTYTLVLYSYLNGQNMTQPFTITTPAATAVTSVSANCGTSVVAGGSTTCAASVQGKGNYSSAVTWSTSVGSITPAGVLTIPSGATSVTVTATSTADSSKVSQTTITVTPASVVSNIAITCAASSLLQGATTTCTAQLYGTGDFSKDVTWISSPAGYITAGGVLTAPSSVTSITIKATSVQNPARSITKKIIVTAPPTAKLEIVNPTFFATPTTVVLSWTVTQKSHNGISSGLTPHYGYTTPYDNNLTTSPNYTFTNLTPGTTYYVLLFSFNDSGTVTTPIVITTPLK